MQKKKKANKSHINIRAKRQKCWTQISIFQRTFRFLYEMTDFLRSFYIRFDLIWFFLSFCFLCCWIFTNEWKAHEFLRRIQCELHKKSTEKRNETKLRLFTIETILIEKQWHQFQLFAKQNRSIESRIIHFRN